MDRRMTDRNDQALLATGLGGTGDTTSLLSAFASEARRFCEWARNPSGDDAGAREALLRVSALYLAGLQLSGDWHSSLEPEPLPDTVSKAEWKQVYAATEALPLQYYSEVTNPLDVPPEDAGVGDLADDVADIYRDIVEGLRLYEAGHPREALWQWVFNLTFHWGAHATSAMRALHWYLSDNESELSGSPDVM
ncbi:MAG: hypothetical protein QOJ16_161 [Acidobacteriota bacterium]|jgi:hypothetical protein|nr:hypothetical protein [Acidobacteriota bacterium]